MAEKVDIFMPFYVADYLADTTDLSTEEHGAYVLLLLTLWRSEGVLPNDPRRLARIAKVPFERWPDIWSAIGRFFDVSDATVSQGRLVEERERALRLKQASSDGGKKSADARKAKNGTAQPSNPLRTTFEPPSEGSAEAKPEVSSNISESPSQEESPPSAGACDPSGQEPQVGLGPTGMWTAQRWLAAFKAAWSKAHNDAFYGRGAGDARALGTLQDQLDALPQKIRFEAEQRAGTMLAEFLADQTQKATTERHQFSYFVLLFNGLRVAKKATAERCYWHGKGNRGPSRQPLDTCPECREEKARNRGRTGDPTPIGTWKGLEQPKAPPTAEQLEELRIARKAMLPGAQAPQATDPKSGAA